MRFRPFLWMMPARKAIDYHANQVAEHCEAIHRRAIRSPGFARIALATLKEIGGPVAASAAVGIATDVRGVAGTAIEVVEHIRGPRLAVNLAMIAMENDSPTQKLVIEKLGKLNTSDAADQLWVLAAKDEDLRDDVVETLGIMDLEAMRESMVRVVRGDETNAARAIMIFKDKGGLRGIHDVIHENPGLVPEGLSVLEEVGTPAAAEQIAVFAQRHDRAYDSVRLAENALANIRKKLAADPERTADLDKLDLHIKQIAEILCNSSAMLEVVTMHDEAEDRTNIREEFANIAGCGTPGIQAFRLVERFDHAVNLAEPSPGDRIALELARGRQQAQVIVVPAAVPPATTPVAAQ